MRTILSSVLEPHEFVQHTVVPEELTPQQSMVQTSVKTPALYPEAECYFIVPLFMGYSALLFHRDHTPLVGWYGYAASHSGVRELGHPGLGSLLKNPFFFFFF